MNIENKDKIYKAWIDPSAKESKDSDIWEYMPNARAVNGRDAIFSPAVNFAERAAVPEQVKPETTIIGGICQIFTGDFSQANQAVDIVRMDQLIETVGMVEGMDVLFVAEDSLFASLTGIDQQKFTDQAYVALERLKRITKKVGVTNINMVLTSDIENALREQVQVLSMLIGNSDFAEIGSAPVMLMYTQLWSELLTSLGYLNSPAVVCIEPSRHFMQKQRFPDRKMQRAYQDFISWLEDQPYAQVGSKNELFGAIGFTPSENEGKRTRLLPYQSVPNTENYQAEVSILQKALEDFPFPLKKSKIFITAVNYLRWNKEALELLVKLADLENGYYEEKKTISVQGTIRSSTPQEERDRLIQTKRLVAGQLKNDYQRRAQPLLNELLGLITISFQEILGD